jgi:hypothetical protein
VLSFPLWQRHFDSNPEAVGRTLELNGSPYVIAGVLRRDFAVTPVMAGLVYVPIGPRVATALDNRRAAQFDLLGRLQEGTDAGEALAAIRTAAAQLERDYPDVNRELSRRFIATSTDAFGMLRGGPIGRVLLGAATAVYGLAGLALLVACANVAGLLLVRATERRAEISIRIALGATRWRIAQRVLVESLVVAGLGCTVGLGLWSMAVVFLKNWIAAAASVEATALSAALPVGYSGLLVVFVTAVCGLAPAFHSVRLTGPVAIRIPAGIRLTQSSRLQRGLVAFQIAVSYVLLSPPCASWPMSSGCTRRILASRSIACCR